MTEPLRRSPARRFQHLDMLRGLCAIGVVVSHVRSLLVVPFAQAHRHGLGELVLYTAGGLGHECVIVFFALSGFLVGGSALAAMREKRFSWSDYAAARLSRLWTVLVPALALTLLVDEAGAALAPPETYAGAYAAEISSGPTAAAPASHSLATFLGNLFFLQTIATPVFGTNAPLWSLSNEAWYYVAIPLVAFGAIACAGAARIAFVASGLLVLIAMPYEMAGLSLPWIAGALASLYPAGEARKPALVATAAMVAALGLAHVSRTLASDILLGCVVAVWLRHLAVIAPRGGLYAWAARGLSEISYTLYAVHFPLMLMLWFSLFAPAQSQPGLAPLAQICAFVAVAVLYGAGVWFLFERRTNVVRGWMTDGLRRLRRGCEALRSR